MRLPKPPPCSAIFRWTRGLLCCAAVGLPALAQEAVLLEPVTELSPGSLGDELREADSMTGLEVAEPVEGTSAGASAPGSRRWKVAPHLDATATYDDNIFIQPRNEIADFIFTLAPGLAIGLWDRDEVPEDFFDRQQPASTIQRDRGSFLLLDYTAILLGFVRESSQNAFDQDALIEGRWEDGRLTLSGRVHFESKSAANIDVGGRVRTNTLESAVTARYQLTGRTALEGTVSHTRHDPEDFVRSIEWRAESFLDYAISPVVRSGLGLAVGQVEVEGGADQVFQQLLARANCSLTEKSNFELQLGVDFRQSDGAAGDRNDPIFRALGSWEVAAKTRLGLEAFRRVENSALQPDLDLLRTNVAVNARRVVHGGLHVTLAGGYETTEYGSIDDTEDRRDRYYFVRPGLLYNFAAWGNLEGLYEFRRNRSTRADSEFENNLITVRLSLIY